MASRPIRVVLGSLSALVLAVAAGWWASASAPDTRGSLPRALAATPASVETLNFTDWADIRADLGADDVVQAAAARDLGTRSVLARSADRIDAFLGVSPATVDWEAFSQAPEGRSLVLGLPGRVDAGAWRSRLEAAGYVRSANRWSVDASTLAAADLRGAPELAHVAVLAGRGVLVAADSPEHLDEVVGAVSGGGASLASLPETVAAADSVRGADSVLVNRAGTGCAAVDPADRDPELAPQVDAALARAGRLLSHEVSIRAIDDDGEQVVTFAMTFGSSGEAARQADVRSRLATGPAIGRSGDVADELRLRSASSHGLATVLRFDREPDAAVVMSGTATFLFAACR